MLCTDQRGDARDVGRSKAISCADQMLFVVPGHFDVDARRAKLNRWMGIVRLHEWIMPVMGSY